MPLSGDEGQGRWEAARGEGRVAVSAPQPLGRLPEGADESGVDFIERLPGTGLS